MSPPTPVVAAVDILARSRKRLRSRDRRQLPVFPQLPDYSAVLEPQSSITIASKQQNCHLPTPPIALLRNR
ncbi:hypothetical protein BDDG_12029 [Blastomyces dermatitidis ATCC 18188]|uniref:Uncharacterized protein n=1 Tax=Ajellomyces dermatitidis (strain ATCC 18188 / CBS 674.68) TaxID=653446 RepID=A0A0J9ELS9_AJEDA|nr:hypothetical protein BDDG_12029 [Blastomyces dermatitidis ATCC 18188]